MRLTSGRIVGSAAGLARITGVLVLAALVSGCAGPASPPPVAVPAPQPAEQPAETAAASPVSLTVFAAASLRDALDAAAAAYRDSDGEHDRPGDGLLDGPSNPDRAGRARRRLPVRGHEEPAMRSRPPAWSTAPSSRSPATSWPSSSRRTTPPGSPRRSISGGPASRSSPPVNRSRSRPTRRPCSRGWPRSPARRPISKPHTRRTSSAGKTTSRRRSPRSSWAKATSRSSIRPTRPPPARSRPSRSRRTHRSSRRTPGRCRPRPISRAAGHAFLDWLAGPDGQAILAGFGFITAS